MQQKKKSGRKIAKTCAKFIIITNCVLIIKVGPREGKLKALPPQLLSSWMDGGPILHHRVGGGGWMEKECAILPITAAAHNSTLASFLTLIRTSKWPCKLMKIHILVVYCGARYYYYYYYARPRKSLFYTHRLILLLLYTSSHNFSSLSSLAQEAAMVVQWLVGWLVVLCL